MGILSLDSCIPEVSGEREGVGRAMDIPMMAFCIAPPMPTP